MSQSDQGDGLPEEPLPEDLRGYFRSARSDLDEGQRVARVARRLGPLLDAPAPAAGSVLKVTAVVALLVAAGAAGIWAWRGRSNGLSSTSIASPAGSRAAPDFGGTTTVPLSAPSSEAPVASVLPPATPAPSVRSGFTATPSVDPIVEEHSLLAEARRSKDAAPQKTLSLVQQHQQRFPNGSLSSEREFLRIAALSKLGRTSEARVARDRFVARWPSSAYRAEIDRLVGP